MLGSLEEGTVLKERYRLTGMVGQGGMGNVYRAEDLRLPGRLCAVKEVQQDPGTPEDIRQQEHAQFLREASLLAQLDHPNLPKVSDFFAEKGRDYLVMDYVPGNNLKELIDDSRMKGGHLEVELVLTWAKQILSAVSYLHRQEPPVLHRDIKPANIKLTPDGRIKLVDFGLAKIMAGDDSSTITVIQGRGTAYYTPLEQYGAESEHTDARSDIYALGATLYHLMSGTSPPEAKERFLNPTVLRPLHAVNPMVSKELSDAVDWALEMHPDDRPNTVELLLQAINGQITLNRDEELAIENNELGRALSENAVMIVIAMILLVAAVFLTIN